MASQARRGVVSPPKRHNPNSSGGGSLSIISRFSQSRIVSRGRQAACNTAFVAKKLLKSTGKAARFAGATFLVLVVPLMIEIDREQQLNDLELQQASLPSTPPISQK